MREQAACGFQMCIEYTKLLKHKAKTVTPKGTFTPYYVTVNKTRGKTISLNK